MTVAEPGNWSATASPATDNADKWQWNLENFSDAWECASDGSKHAANVHYVLDPAAMTGSYAAYSPIPVCPGNNVITQDGFYWAGTVDYTLSKTA